MLRVYTRHYPPCSRTDSGYRRCHCPKWINGNLPTGKFVRISANTRSWESADRKARLMEINADPLRQGPADDNTRITIEEAIRDFHPLRGVPDDPFLQALNADRNRQATTVA